ncbi:hypothetical protein AVEN_86745-1 [Araneus ventricosus]|uniref:DUF7041 domain-containing protein n=1 Tax=Araneus ventricosus TaxID=182803 RepID=A0A4Y2JHH8_ARAVE|nr:hypothetical protein AVEN_86745-1 [Araneus ventricosus]
MVDKGVARFSVKLLPLWRDNAEIWFTNLEYQIEIVGITASQTKFHHIVASLDSEISSLISNIYRNHAGMSTQLQTGKVILQQPLWFFQGSSKKTKNFPASNRST